jgi:hypothetical protein
MLCSDLAAKELPKPDLLGWQVVMEGFAERIAIVSMLKRDSLGERASAADPLRVKQV